MSGSVPPPPPPGPPPPGLPPSQASVLGPGIVGLLVQGIETGLIFAEFSRWFYRPGRRENFMSSTVVIFVTVIGLYVSSRIPNCVTSSSIVVYEVRSPAFAFHLLGISTYDNLGWTCVSPSLACCVGDTPLMLKFRLSRARTGSITFRQSQCVENPSYLTAPNPVCRPWPYRLPYRLL